MNGTQKVSPPYMGHIIWDIWVFEIFILFLASGDWRKKLEMQPGAVLATELKNNNCKLARWTTQEQFRKYYWYI